MAQGCAPAFVHGGDGDVHRELVAVGDLLQQVEVARDERGLGDDAERKAAGAGKDLEKGAGDALAALQRLVGVGGRAQGDLGAGLELLQLLLEQPGGVLLEEDLVLEVLRCRSSRNSWV